MDHSKPQQMWEVCKAIFNASVYAKLPWIDTRIPFSYKIYVA